jgi:hypothetical protein
MPAIAIVTSQAAQFSVLGDLQLEAQRKTVRALAYHDHLTLYAVAENQLAKLGTPKLAILPSPQALTDAAWQTLLKYVDDGGNLLITGPVDRDEHWHVVERSAALKVGAEVEPLMFHNAALAGGRSIPLSFDQQAQNLVESMRFGDGSTLKEIAHGKGRIFWAAYPVEMAEGTDAAAALYSYVASRVGVAPLYDVQGPVSPGLLIFPIVMEDAVLYIMASESAEDAQIDLKDKTTGTSLRLKLAGQRAAVAVVSRKSRGVVARYGF